MYNRIRQQGKALAKRPSKLDPFQEYTDSGLKDFSIPATVLVRELRERGYDGGITILKDHMHDLRKRHAARVTRRFETEPGRQAHSYFMIPTPAVGSRSFSSRKNASLRMIFRTLIAFCTTLEKPLA